MKDNIKQPYNCVVYKNGVCGYPIEACSECPKHKTEQDYMWHVNVDIYDDSDAPVEEGWYEVVDTELNQTVDYFFGRPRITERGIGYWKTIEKPIIAWRKTDQWKDK